MPPLNTNYPYKYYCSQQYFSSFYEVFINANNSASTIIETQYNTSLVLINKSTLPPIEKILALSSWGFPVFWMEKHIDVFVEWDDVFEEGQKILQKIINRSKLPRELDSLVIKSIKDLGLNFHYEDLLE